MIRSLAWLRRSRTVVAQRRCRMRLDGVVSGGGTLRFGLQWPGRFHRESHLVLRAGGTLAVAGAFDIYSGATVTIAEGATLRLGSGTSTAMRRSRASSTCRSGTTSRSGRS